MFFHLKLFSSLLPVLSAADQSPNNTQTKVFKQATRRPARERAVFFFFFFFFFFSFSFLRWEKFVMPTTA